MSAYHLEELKVAARYHRDRLALYRARVYGGSLTSDTRLRELERASDFAAQRLHQAQREHAHPRAASRVPPDEKL